MDTNTAQPERKFAITPEELSSWQENGYFVRYDVFTEAENDILRHIADDIAVGKRLFPKTNINQNALVRDGKVDASGIRAMHKIHHVSCYIPEFLARVRDVRLTDPIVDLLGPNILGLNNLYIWKSPRDWLRVPVASGQMVFQPSVQN